MDEPKWKLKHLIPSNQSRASSLLTRKSMLTWAKCLDQEVQLCPHPLSGYILAELLHMPLVLKGSWYLSVHQKLMLRYQLLLLFTRQVASSSFVTHQAPLTMGFLRQESWSGLPFPPPGDLANPGSKPESPAWQPDSLPLSPQGSPHLLLVHLNNIRNKSYVYCLSKTIVFCLKRNKTWTTQKLCAERPSYSLAGAFELA